MLTFPYMTRRLESTASIATTGDFTTAAYMLNDCVETVLRCYQELRDRDH